MALPVPMDRTFTYALPANLRGRVLAGCRVLVPFRSRTVAGVVLRCHGEKPDFAVRAVKRLLDSEPALTEDLIELGRWVARYYCTPVGEVLKSMLPLQGETRRKKVVSLTEAGRTALEESLDLGGTGREVLASLGRRPLTYQYLAGKHRGGGAAIELLSRRGLVTVEQVLEERDPTMARDAVLTVKAVADGPAPAKPGPGERWLLDYLGRNPGAHDLRALSVQRADVVPSARKLAKAGAIRLEVSRERRRACGGEERFDLSEAQARALGEIEAALASGRFKTFLLHGVTGSGKTEVYLRAAEKALALDRSALVLVPEIALTPASAAQFFSRFGDQVAVLHSALSGPQRSDQWRRIRSGRARVVLGTRSAVFAPVRDLGLVVVDEEHDGSYKQADAPRYNGRDVAVVRGRSAGAAVVLGSATPGMETRHNAETGKYGALSMETRILDRPLPSVRTIDMRREFAETGRARMFSREVSAAVRACLDRGEQAMILLNRRGFSSYVICRKCGQRVECSHCSVTLVYHRAEERLLCHYCDHAEAVPSTCAACGSNYLHFHGSGSEKVEDELQRSFPEASIARLDRDSVQGRDSYETILNSFRDGRCNLLVGTQMIAKGHDIPAVTLVCVVDADVGLGRPDFRAAERTFQLLTQVAGRAGRGEKPGEVLIQTMNPGHYAITLAAGQDYAAFYERETRFRKALWYPPFTSMALIVVRSANLSEAVAMSADLGRRLQPVADGLRLIGPASAPMAKLRAEYRFQFLLKSVNRPAMAAVLGAARRHAEERNWPATALIIDVDPVDFL